MAAIELFANGASRHFATAFIARDTVDDFVKHDTARLAQHARPARTPRRLSATRWLWRFSTATGYSNDVKERASPRDRRRDRLAAIADALRLFLDPDTEFGFRATNVMEPSYSQEFAGQSQANGEGDVSSRGHLRQPFVPYLGEGGRRRRRIPSHESRHGQRCGGKRFRRVGAGE